MLLADEPVSMLDVSIRLGVLNLLAGLRDRERLAILYVTHDIASARYLADVIAVMYAGQVVESGPAAQVTDAARRTPTRSCCSAAAPDPDRAEPPSLRGRGAPPSLISAAGRLPVPPALPVRHGGLRRANAPPASRSRRGIQRVLAARARPDRRPVPAALGPPAGHRKRSRRPDGRAQARSAWRGEVMNRQVT